jgi:hypothetical protein
MARLFGKAARFDPGDINGGRSTDLPPLFFV